MGVLMQEMIRLARQAGAAGWRGGDGAVPAAGAAF